MPENQVKRKRVKIEFGKKPRPVLLKLFLFITIAAGILLVFYMFSLVELKPESQNAPSNSK